MTNKLEVKFVRRGDKSYTDPFVPKFLIPGDYSAALWRDDEPWLDIDFTVAKGQNLPINVTEDHKVIVSSSFASKFKTAEVKPFLAYLITTAHNEFTSINYDNTFVKASNCSLVVTALCLVMNVNDPGIFYILTISTAISIACEAYVINKGYGDPGEAALLTADRYDNAKSALQKVWGEIGGKVKAKTVKLEHLASKNKLLALT